VLAPVEEEKWLAMNAAAIASGPLTSDNYEYSWLAFEGRQAGISLVFDNEGERFYYNAYCIEGSLLSELFSVEFTYLEDALQLINEEFGTWTLEAFEEKSGCGSCVAK
jgi:hypothetical protein